MKKIYTLVSAVILSASLWAQAPQKMSYQSVIRNASNALVINQKVGIRISLLQGSETGTAVYIESHKPTTNTNGLASLEIGGGTVSTGDFSKIDWSKGPYFVKTETDVAGGTNYQLTAVSELMSVPYAIHAKTAESIVGGSVLPSGGTNGQILTNCDGIPTWTTGGICPGKITSLNCSGVSVNGSLTYGVTVSNVSFLITYSGGNGGSYLAQSVSSTGIIGLTANLQASSFATGNGSLTFSVSGTPTSEGNALFSLNIGGQACSVSILVQEKPSTIGIPGPNISDNDGNTYKTVYIGTQQWMAENLKVTKYNDGTLIPYVTDNTQWQNNTTGAWSYYNNDAANNAKYGKLYNWYAVSPTTNGNKNVCPTGWHVPTDAEWTVLIDYLGGEGVAGGKMKEVGTTSWNSPNTDATNTSLFTGLPGGYRYDYGSYGDVGYGGNWWSSSEYFPTTAWYRLLGYGSGGADRSGPYKRYGFSVRCLRD